MNPGVCSPAYSWLLSWSGWRECRLCTCTWLSRGHVVSFSDAFDYFSSFLFSSFHRVFSSFSKGSHGYRLTFSDRSPLLASNFVGETFHKPRHTSGSSSPFCFLAHHHDWVSVFTVCDLWTDLPKKENSTWTVSCPTERRSFSQYLLISSLVLWCYGYGNGELEDSFLFYILVHFFKLLVSVNHFNIRLPSFAGCMITTPILFLSFGPIFNILFLPPSFFVSVLDGLSTGESDTWRSIDGGIQQESSIYTEASTIQMLFAYASLGSLARRTKKQKSKVSSVQEFVMWKRLVAVLFFS